MDAFQSNAFQLNTFQTTAYSGNYTIFTTEPTSNPTDSGTEGIGVEVGTQFYSDVTVQVTAARFYKQSTDSSTHISRLWAAIDTIHPADMTSGFLSTQNDSVPYTLGMKFTSDAAGYIHGVRLYKANQLTTDIVCSIWSSGGTKLATVTMVGSSNTGWQYVFFATPLAVTASTEYVVSYTTTDYFKMLSNFFDTTHTHGHLTASSGATSVYNQSASEAFPTTNSSHASYCIDPLFSTHSILKLAEVTYTGETASGWQEMAFSSPVTIEANEVYTISTHFPSGHYSYSSNYFTTNITNAPLTAIASTNSYLGGNGIYIYDSGDTTGATFPINTLNNTNYWVDVKVSTSSSATYSASVSGGSVVGGSSVLSNNINISIAGSNGSVAGGSGAIAKSTQQIGSSGSVVGGTATISSTGLQTYSVTSTLGAIAGGTTQIDRTVTLSTIGIKGAICGGLSNISYGIINTSSLGAIVGGNSDITQSKSQLTTIGAICGGSSDLVLGYIDTVNGGVVASGNADIVQSKSQVTTLGAVIGGNATIINNQRNDYIIMPTGGCISAGSSAISVSVNIISDGGLIAGGNSTFGSGNNISQIATGGAIVIGEATLDAHKTFSIISSNGTIVGGKADLSTTNNLQSIGGCVIGGSSSISNGKALSSIGGVNVGGQGNILFGHTYILSSTGGSVCNGLSDLSKGLTLNPLGGAVISGYAEGLLIYPQSILDISFPSKLPSKIISCTWHQADQEKAKERYVNDVAFG